MNFVDYITYPFIWLNAEYQWYKNFLVDAKTGKPSLTAVMKLGIIIGVILAVGKVVLSTQALPSVPYEYVFLIVIVIFEKQSGRLIEAWLESKIGGFRKGPNNDDAAVPK